MMKSHHVIISAGIFILCWLVFGFRGVDAGIVGIVCYLGGVKVGHKEQEVAEAIDRLKTKFFAWIS